MKDSCKLCFNSNFIHVDGEVVCQDCGTVNDAVVEPATVPQKTHLSVMAESKLGSSHIIDPELGLPNLNMKLESKIIDKTDAYLNYFSQVCSDLKMPQSIARNAFYLFQKLRYEKCGLGRTAVFCIIHAYAVSDALYDGPQIIDSVRTRFKLKRKITIQQALYRVKPTAIRLCFLNKLPDSDMLTIKKNIDPEFHNPAVKILDCFEGDMKSKTKHAQQFLEAYHVPVVTHDKRENGT